MSGAARCSLRIDGPEGAPAVVLLHAVATTSAMWTHQVPVLAQRFRVVSVDLPGHGTAPSEGDIPNDLQGYADAVVDAMSCHGIARAALVGASFGGMVAQRVAISRPNCVGALVLAHCGARTTPEVSAVWETRMKAMHDADGMTGQVDGTLARWFTPDFLHASPWTMGWVANMIRSTRPEAYIASVRAIQQMDHVKELGAIRTPTLCLAGGSDTAVPVNAVSALSDHIPGSHYALMEGAPHMAAIEHAQRFTELIAPFLATHCTAS